MARISGITTALVAAGTVACGLLLLAGVGPSPAGAQLAGERPPSAATGSGVAASWTDGSTATAGTGKTTTMAAMDTATDTATNTATDTATTPTTTAGSAASAPPEKSPATSPVPLSVSPESVTVGVGGVARISGTCPVVEGAPLGPVEIWEVGETVEVIPTGVSAAEWTYDWTAPERVESLVLQAWCGDPDGYPGGYPADLQIEVVFVAQEAPTTTTAVLVVDETIPETD